LRIRKVEGKTGVNKRGSKPKDGETNKVECQVDGGNFEEKICRYANCTNVGLAG
jgi:hypothetical protein